MTLKAKWRIPIWFGWPSCGSVEPAGFSYLISSRLVWEFGSVSFTKWAFTLESPTTLSTHGPSSGPSWVTLNPRFWTKKLVAESRSVTEMFM